MEDINKCIANYKEQLETGNTQKTYKFLLNYLMNLKAYLSKNSLKEYSLGNISPGYMDYSYFPFFDEYLREHKLRFGIVLNHSMMQFELWLMGQNTDIQNDYRNKLKDTDWNKNKKAMPQYSVLEIVLVKSPDFSNLGNLTELIAERTIADVNEVLRSLKHIVIVPEN